MDCRIVPVVSALALAVPLAVSGCKSGGRERASEPASMPTPEELQARMEELGRAGEEHRRLDPMAGEFRYEVKAWMAPGEPPVVSQGTTSNRWVLGGLYLENEVRGTWMGEPFEGRLYLGYDKSRDKYTSVWLDSSSTVLWPVAHGTASDDGMTITLVRDDAYDPMLETEVDVREVIRIQDRDRHVYEMYSRQDDGEEMKVMEIVYTRVR